MTITFSKREYDSRGRYWQERAVYTGQTGDTGFTWTPKSIKRIINGYVSAYKTDGSAAVAGLTWRMNKGIAPSTITVAYTDPTANHTIIVSCFGLRK